MCWQLRAIAAVLVAIGVGVCAPGSHADDIADRADREAEREQFLEDLSRRTFAYFWDTTDARTCLAPDRWPSAPFSSIAAIGFALTAYGVGAERGYVTREAAARRTLDCLAYLYSLPQGPETSGSAGHKGFFYHFLSLEDGTRHASNELSSIDTSLLLAGVLFVQAYFDRDDPAEFRIREAADTLYRRTDWTFFLRGPDDLPATNLAGSRGVAMGWKPESGFEPHDWVGYNEGMLVYVLALGSPTHPVTRDTWDQGWAAILDEGWQSYYGQEHLTFGPLFGHQYAHIWIDFRGIQDAFMQGKGIDYFENSRRATLSQYQYAQENPFRWTGYGGDLWGLTACDGPGGGDGVAVGADARIYFRYAARGAGPARVHDDGTIAPTAAGGSIVFTPDLSVAALMTMKDRYGEHLYTEYGFKDSFNPSLGAADHRPNRGLLVTGLGWFADDHVGIDQGPILLMLENHRSELIWRTMRSNPYIRRGLKEIGFRGGWLE